VPPQSPAAQPTHRSVIIIAPMEVERGAIAQALHAADLEDRVQLVRSGIGAERILATLNSLFVARGREHAPPPTLVILAGCAGGLADLPLDRAAPIAMVVDEAGNEWIPSYTPPHIAAGDDDTNPETLGPPPDPIAVLGVDRLIDEPAEKRRLHHTTGASIVDMESHAFARRCTELAWPWAVVRGISDGPDHRVPPIILTWVNPDGSSRNLKALIDMAIRPWLWPEILTLVQHTTTALGLAGAQAAALSAEVLGEAP
jgi:nucleoside phosphorylase